MPFTKSDRRQLLRWLSISDVDDLERQADAWPVKSRAAAAAITRPKAALNHLQSLDEHVTCLIRGIETEGTLVQIGAVLTGLEPQMRQSRSCKSVDLLPAMGQNDVERFLAVLRELRVAIGSCFAAIEAGRLTLRQPHRPADPLRPLVGLTLYRMWAALTDNPGKFRFSASEGGPACEAVEIVLRCAGAQSSSVQSKVRAWFESHPKTRTASGGGDSRKGRKHPF